MAAPDPGTLNFWGFAIPSVVASVIGGLVTWFLNHRATKEIKGIESRLRRGEEAFRLAQSPRVEAAVKAWAAFCDFERAVESAVHPGAVTFEPDTGTREEKAEQVRKQLREQYAARTKAVVEAWRTLKDARDRAECLLDENTFEKFEALHKACDGAHAGVWAARDLGETKLWAEATGKALKTLEQVKKERVAVARAIRGLIGGDAPGRKGG